MTSTWSNQMPGSRPLPGASWRRRLRRAGPSVVGGECEVESHVGGQGARLRQAIPQQHQVLDPRVHVLLHIPGIGEPYVSGSGWKHLHETNNSTPWTRQFVSQAGPLKCHRRDGYPVEAVLIGVAAEEWTVAVRKLREPVRIDGIADPTRVGEVAPEEDVAEERPPSFILHEHVEARAQLGALGSDGPGDLPAVAKREVLAHDDPVEHQRPEERDVLVRDRELEDPGVDHLEQILHVEARVDLDDLERPQASPYELVRERSEMPDKARRPRHVDPAAGQVVEVIDGFRGSAGDEELVDVAEVGRAEGHLLPTLGGSRWTPAAAMSPRPASSPGTSSSKGTGA